MVDRVATWDRTLKRMGAKQKPAPPVPDRMREQARPLPAHVMKRRRLEMELELYR
jgi:hypothetical protein